MEPDETMVAKREKRKDSFGRLSFWFWARAGKPLLRQQLALLDALRLRSRSHPPSSCAPHSPAAGLCSDHQFGKRARCGGEPR